MSAALVREPFPLAIPATSAQSGLCCVCHAAPRYRRNAQTCRASACLAQWRRTRQAENSHAYRLRKFETGERFWSKIPPY